MKKLAAVVIAISCVLMSSCSGSFIARVEFSGGQGSQATQAQRKIDYDFSSLDSKAAEVDSFLGKPPMLININHKYDTSSLFSAFSMAETDGEKLDNYDGYRYVGGDKRLIVHDDGYIAFYNTSLYGKDAELSDEQCTALANDVITKIALDTSGLSANSIYTSGNCKILHYSREINGIKAVSASGLTFYFEGDGISQFYQNSSYYEGELEFEPIGVHAALDKLLTDASTQTFGRDNNGVAIKNVRVEDVSLVYWDSFKSQFIQTHIQPVYLFTGTATDADGTETVFTAYVRAVSDDITASMGVSRKLTE